MNTMTPKRKIDALASNMTALETPPQQKHTHKLSSPPKLHQNHMARLVQPAPTLAGGSSDNVPTLDLSKNTTSVICTPRLSSITRMNFDGGDARGILPPGATATSEQNEPRRREDHHDGDDDDNEDLSDDEELAFFNVNDIHLHRDDKFVANNGRSSSATTASIRIPSIRIPLRRSDHYMGSVASSRPSSFPSTPPKIPDVFTLTSERRFTPSPKTNLYREDDE